MLIQSLCHFTLSPGKRRARATTAVRELFREQTSALRWICAAAIVMQLAPLMIPLVLRFFLPEVVLNSAGIDNGSDGVESQISPEFPDHQMTLLWSLSACVALIGVIRAVSTYLFLKWGGQCGHSFVAAFRKLAYAQLMRLPVRYVEQRGSGRILLRFIGDTDALRNWVSRTGPKMTADAVTATAILIAMVSVSFTMTLLFVLPLAAMTVVVVYYSSRLRSKTRESRRCQSHLTGHVAERLNAIRSTKIVDAQSNSRQPFLSLVQQVAVTNASRDRLSALLESAGQLAVFSAFPLVLVVGFRQSWSGRLASTDFMTFLWLAIHLITIVRTSLPAIVIHQKALVSVQRLHAFLSRAAESGRGNKPVKTSSWTLEVEYCVRGSDTGLESESGAARFASFTCQSPGVYELPEQISAERLFASLMGFEKWQQGSLRLGGGEISSTDVARRRRKILRLSPIPQLIDGTLAENLFLYRSKNSDLQQTALLATEQELAELSDLRLPPHLQYCTNELNSRILHSNHRLSPDAERRLAVCQTLLARPQILLIPGATLKAWPAEDLEVVIERTRHRAVVLMAPPSKREVCETASSFSDYTRPSPNSSK